MSVVEMPNMLGDLWAPMPSEWLSEPPPPREWLLVKTSDHAEDMGVLPRGVVGLLASAGGVGKTMLVSQLALLVGAGCGRPFIGEIVVAAPARGGRVLLALGEEDAAEIRRRVFNAALALRLTPEQRDRALGNVVVLPLRGRDCALVGTDPASRTTYRTQLHADLLERLKAEGPWALVILDPMARFSGADAESSNALATQFVSAAEALCAVPGSPALLIAHHTSQVARNTGDRSAVAARGVTGLVDGVRWVATLTTEEESSGMVVCLAVAKTNYSPPIPESFHAKRSREFSGALVPLTDDDEATLEEARRANDRDTKREQKKAARVTLEDEKILAALPEPPGSLTLGGLLAALAGDGLGLSEKTLRNRLDGLADRGYARDLSGGSRGTKRAWARTGGERV